MFASHMTRFFFFWLILALSHEHLSYSGYDDELHRFEKFRSMRAHFLCMEIMKMKVEK